MREKTATEKAAALAGSTTAVLAAMVPAADAAITVANGFRPGDTAPPRVPDDAGQFFWDVDGNGSSEFRLIFKSRTTIVDGEIVTTDAGFFGSEFGSAGMVNYSSSAASKARNLPLHFEVGSTLATDYYWGTGGRAADRILTSGGVQVGSGFDGGVFGSDQNYIGFRFDIGENTHYGWAQLSLASQQIVAGAYNDTPGGAINVGQIPEPSSMALLGLGAAGLAILRRRKSA